MTSALAKLVENLVGRPRGGLGVGVVSGADGAFHSHGEARPGNPVDESTLFEIGSITKVFAGILLAELVLEGRVALEDRPSVYLPELRLRVDPTLIDLATHRSGLPNVARGLGWRELAFALGVASDPHAGLTREAYEEALARTSARRSKMRYSSLAVGLLGEALAAAAGRTYEDERVLHPLKMGETVVDAPPERLVAASSRRGKPRPPFKDPMLVPAGGLRSSARDMTRFLRASREPAATPLGPALTLAQQPHSRPSRQIAVGLGWIISRKGRVAFHWHNGATSGFRSFAGLERASGRAVVVLSNRQHGVERTAFRLLESLPPASGRLGNSFRNDDSPHGLCWASARQGRREGS